MRVLTIVVLAHFEHSLAFGDSCQFCAISEGYLQKHPGDVDKWKTYCEANNGLCQLSNWDNLPCKCDTFHNCDEFAGVLPIGVTFGECVISPAYYIVGGVLGLLVGFVTMCCCQRHNYKGLPPKITQIVLILILLIITAVTIILLTPHIPPWSSFVCVTLVVVAIIYIGGKLFCFNDDDPELKNELDQLIQASENVIQRVIANCKPDTANERLLDQSNQESKNILQHADAIREWACPECTFLNPETSAGCEACDFLAGQEHPEEQKQPEEKQIQTAGDEEKIDTVKPESTNDDVPNSTEVSVTIHVSVPDHDGHGVEEKDDEPVEPHPQTDTKNLGYCVVCLVKPVTHLVFPCGHACMCEGDAHILGSWKASVCPMCRKRIKSIIKIF